MDLTTLIVPAFVNVGTAPSQGAVIVVSPVTAFVTTYQEIN